MRTAVVCRFRRSRTAGGMIRRTLTFNECLTPSSRYDVFTRWPCQPTGQRAV
jgi:hypothetical protein